jgi:nucleotide-binding universal stress UspA family protein
MPQTILIPLDGSVLAERAVSTAGRLARPGLDRLVLMHVTSPVGWGPSDVQEGDLVAALERLAEPLLGANQLVSVAVYNGYFAAPGVVVARAATEKRADLIVMSTHGRGDIRRFAFGSTADEIIRHTSCPLLLLPADCQSEVPTGHPLRVLVPLDGSELAERVLEPVMKITGSVGATVKLIRVVEPLPTSLSPMEISSYAFDPEAELSEARRYLDGVANSLRQKGSEVTSEAIFGHALSLIEEQAQSGSFDLLALATHGRGGLSRLILGSAASALLSRVKVPILLVKPAANN